MQIFKSTARADEGQKQEVDVAALVSTSTMPDLVQRHLSACVSTSIHLTCTGGQIENLSGP